MRSDKSRTQQWLSPKDCCPGVGCELRAAIASLYTSRLRAQECAAQVFRARCRLLFLNSSNPSEQCLQPTRGSIGKVMPPHLSHRTVPPAIHSRTTDSTYQTVSAKAGVPYTKTVLTNLPHPVVLPEPLFPALQVLCIGLEVVKAFKVVVAQH